MASAGGEPMVTIGTLVQGSVGGDVVDIDINKGASAPGEAFNACPYCGQELKLSKTPKFCPYCKERLAAADDDDDE